MKDYTLHMGLTGAGGAGKKTFNHAPGGGQKAGRVYEERGLMAPLGNVEKGELSMLAKRAWRFMAGKGATDEREKEFRHRISIQACGRRISEARRGDYNDIETAFLIILGETKQAVRAADRAGSAGRRVALAKLTEQCLLLGKDVSYAAPLVRNFSKGSMTLETASPKVLWAVFYELGGGKTNNRGTQRRKAWRVRTGK